MSIYTVPKSGWYQFSSTMLTIYGNVKYSSVYQNIFLVDGTELNILTKPTSYWNIRKLNYWK